MPHVPLMIGCLLIFVYIVYFKHYCLLKATLWNSALAISLLIQFTKGHHHSSLGCVILGVDVPRVLNSALFRCCSVLHAYHNFYMQSEQWRAWRTVSHVWCWCKMSIHQPVAFQRRQRPSEKLLTNLHESLQGIKKQHSHEILTCRLPPDKQSTQTGFQTFSFLHRPEIYPFCFCIAHTYRPTICPVATQAIPVTLFCFWAQAPALIWVSCRLHEQTATQVLNGNTHLCQHVQLPHKILQGLRKGRRHLFDF